MNETFDEIPLADQEAIDRLCDEFEAAWKAGGSPRIESYLDQVDTPGQRATLRELLVTELELRRAAGESIDAVTYRERFPKYRDLVEERFGLGETGSFDRSIGGTVDGGDRRTAEERAGRLPTGEPDKTGAPDAADGSPEPRRQLGGRYTLVRALGSGAFGKVYLAQDEALNRQVAIKVLHRKYSKRADFASQFQDEARRLASLDHPHIVPVYDVGTMDDGEWYIVSKYIGGGTLKTRMQAGRAPQQEAIGIIASLADALHHAHLQGLVHRDVKPDNVLLTTNGQALLTDFGLALHEDEQRVRRNEVSGSPPYMAPEQAAGKSQHLDGRTDIWALGVILYELLTGRQPFDGATVPRLFEEIREREPKPPRQIVDAIPEPLERIVLRCLTKALPGRYSTAGDVARELRGLATAPLNEERADASGAILAAVWGQLDPQLQDAFALAYNKKLREGKQRISTRDLFQALVRVGDEAADRLFRSLPAEALPEPMPDDITVEASPWREETRGKSSISVGSNPSPPDDNLVRSPTPGRTADVSWVAAERPMLSDCVAESLARVGELSSLPRAVGPADIFVDIARHGHGQSVARLRQHGIGPEEIDQRVRELQVGLIWPEDQPPTRQPCGPISRTTPGTR